MTEQLKGHGHVTPNADGFLARCGGPSICKVCKAEIAALKAQEPVEYQLRALIRDVTNIPEAGYYMPQSWHDQVIALSLSGKLDAPVSEAKAQAVVMPELIEKLRAIAIRERMFRIEETYTTPEISDSISLLNNEMDEVARLNAAPVQQVSVQDVSAMARILADRNADACNVNREDNWAIYGQDYIDDVKAMLAAAPAAPAADAGMVAVEWAKDAEGWGPALNEAGWLFLSELNEDPQKSALIFNNTKGPLRAAIMKYAEIVTAHRAKGVV